MYSMAWFITFILLLLIEIATVSLVSIWFVIGALAALITSIFTDSLWIQIIVFIIVSIISLLLTRPFVKKVKGYDVIPTNSDRVIGRIGEVTKKFGRNEYGEVKVYGNTWTACSDEVIHVGEKVRVKKIEGVKLVVEKEND